MGNCWHGREENPENRTNVATTAGSAISQEMKGLSPPVLETKCPSPPAQLSIKLRLNTTEEDVKWSGPSNTTIADLKAFLQADRGLASGSFRLFFGGRVLGDNQTLEECKVPNEVVILVVSRAVAETPTRPC
mmetsp:Transcript_49322/g.102889  ORF Transcript_49322/g.102889 Transcript_49322/m.102889 type:complete len:132 (-) Transcript_49322:252-647(-)